MRENAVAIIGGVGVGLALIFGWQGWQGHQASRSAEAAAQHDALRHAAAAGDTDAVEDMARSLRSEHGGSQYAVLAAMRLSQARLAAGDPQAALEALEAAADAAGASPLDELLRLRTARLELAQGDAEAALRRLDTLSAGHFAGLAAELRGDAERALERPDAARQAYADALTHLDAATPIRALVELKLTDLGGEPVTAPEA